MFFYIPFEFLKLIEIKCSNNFQSLALGATYTRTLPGLVAGFNNISKCNIFESKCGGKNLIT